MSIIKTLLIAAEVCASVYISRKIFWYFAEKHMRNKRKENGVDYLKTNKGILFGLDGIENICKHPHDETHCRNWQSCSNGKLNLILDLLKNSKKSLDVCIYIFTSDVIGKCILEAKQKGIKVRVITDAEMVLLKTSYIQVLANKGVSVKFESSKFIMHHKFVIIDGEILFMGSMNFTSTAVISNWESLIITSVPKLVNAYTKKFEELWCYLNRQ